MTLRKNRNFIILLSGQLVSTVGNNLFGIALPWYVYALTNSKSALALTGVAQTLPAVVGLVAGVWVDRWPKRATMISSDLIRALLSLILLIDILLHWPFWTILVMVLALQAVGQFFNPASGALFPLLVEEKDITSGSGLLQSSNATAQLAGTVSGGALMGVFGAPLLFLLDAISFFVSVISLFFIKVKETIVPREPATTEVSGDVTGTASLNGPNRPEAKGRVRAFLQDWGAGFALIGKSKFLILIICAALVTNFALAPIDIALTAWVKGPMHGSPLSLGIINGGFFLGAILGGVLLGLISKLIPLRALLLIGLVGIGVCAAAFGQFYSTITETIFAVLAGLTAGSVNGSLSATFIQLIPAPMRGRAFGILGALLTFAMPLGMSLFGVLMVHVSLQVVFIVVGSITVLSGMSFLLPIKNDQELLREASAQPVSSDL